MQHFRAPPMCCKQRTCAIPKSFKCNTYKKHRGVGGRRWWLTWISTFPILSASGRIPPLFQEKFMNRRALLASFFFACLSLAPFVRHVIADERPLSGYSAESSRAERQWEEKLRAIPKPENLRAYMQRLSSPPHHVRSPYDKYNAEWIAAKFKKSALHTHIEQFTIHFQTPKNRPVKLIEGGPK